MDEKTKQKIIDMALERAEVKFSTDLYQYVQIIDNICSTVGNDTLRRQAVMQVVLEELVMQAWSVGVRVGEQRATNEALQST